MIASARSGGDARSRRCYPSPMTFQVTMSGSDGMVMASDLCEFDGAELSSSPKVKNLIRKVAISGSFAWAFSDGRLGPFFSPFLQRALDSAGDVSCEDAVKILESCGGPALAEWRNVATGPAGISTIVFACGRSKRIFRVAISPNMTAQEMMGGKCISGNYYNLATFLPTRFHTTEETVDTLARLAAYSIRTASEIDPQIVDGFDLAMYRDSLRRFEFEDGATYWNTAEEIDRDMRNYLRGPVQRR